MTSSAAKRASKVPPIPGVNPASPPPTQTRAPPPPPPGAPPKKSTGDGRTLTPKHPNYEESDEEVTEYDGDYDTDIASAVPHKDALKNHAREPSLDDSTTAGDTPVRSPVTSAPLPPPIPQTSAPRAVPPPPPSQPPKNRTSMDMPRVAPPPPPPKTTSTGDDGEYDPYRYSGTKHSVPIDTGRSLPDDEDDLYSVSPQRATYMPTDWSTRPPPPSQPPPVQQPPHMSPQELPQSSQPSQQQSQLMHPGSPSQASRAQMRKSMETGRAQQNAGRNSEQGRPSIDRGHIAEDVDLGKSSFWWIQPNLVPPVFQNRRDILYEMEESTGIETDRSMKTREVYVLFRDYSQTIVTATFDPNNPSDVNLEQRHEPPPPSLRQDQLEDAHMRFGKKVSEGATSKKDTVVGSGEPQALVLELLKPLTGALLPVGTRSYGALVYANLANASTQQYDEIRAGDIITLRNTKFQGHRGPMHQKYSAEIGKPDHVGVVVDWDGTKKKVRAWEQGRENKKVKLESFKLDDLRSGEVKIWRIMGKNWVGWGSEE